jgi:hypothetical protein
MPRYFFNTRIGDELISDPDGEVLRDPDRAWEMARAMIQELLKTEGANGALLNATIEVTDDEARSCSSFLSRSDLDAPRLQSPGINHAPSFRGTRSVNPDSRFPVCNCHLRSGLRTSRMTK